MSTKLKTIFTSAATTLMGAGWLTLAIANPNNVRGPLDADTVLLIAAMAFATAVAAGATAREVNDLLKTNAPPPRP
jgi:hypothetical protein